MNTNLDRVKLARDINPSATRESAWTQPWFLSRSIKFQVGDCLYFSADRREIEIKPRLADET